MRAARARPDPDAGLVQPRRAAEDAARPRRATLARLLGAAGMVTLTFVLLWLLTDASFRVSETGVTVSGLVHADEAEVRAHLAGLERSPNAFRVRASEIVSRLQDLPAVISATAQVHLPHSVSIEVQERQPLFVWSDGTKRLLVDDEGVLFAAARGEEPGLPVVEDGRLTQTPLQTGSRLPVADLVVMRQLLALTPERLNSTAERLELRVDELDGYVLESDLDWQAVFGHYTATLQPPSVVPRQVQCLSWLLAAHERTLERTHLAVSESACGTLQEVRRSG
jgi:cell division septal protein FtsQ